jgi:ElaB/YqjD/DUF883 family membrane-anchored ribosome-binding protein
MHREEPMATVTESAAGAIREYGEPVRAAVEENLRDVRRAVVAGRHAAEDCAAETTRRVRRHPFAALSLAAGLGGLLGGLIGFAIGRVGGGRPSD